MRFSLARRFFHHDIPVFRMFFVLLLLAWYWPLGGVYLATLLATLDPARAAARLVPFEVILGE